MSRYDILIGRTIEPIVPEIKLVSDKSVNKKSYFPLHPFLPDATIQIQRNSLIQECLRTAHGRALLAQSMTNPIRQRMDRNSFARRIFRVDPLQQAAEPIYNRNTFFIGEDGEQVIHTIEDGRVLPMFEIASNPSIPYSSLREGRYDLIERAINIASSQLKSAEEERSLMLLNIVMLHNPRNNINTPILNLASLQHGFSLIEENSTVQNVFINARNYSVLRSVAGEFLDISTHREIRACGILANLWGAQINVSRQVPDGQVFLTTEPGFVGVMPIRNDVTVLSADSPPSIGWSIFETIGMCCSNPQCVATITIDNQETVKNVLPEIQIVRKNRYQILRGL